MGSQNIKVLREHYRLLMPAISDELLDELMRSVADFVEYECSNARIYERRIFILDSIDKNELYLAKRRQALSHNHHFDLESYDCWCGITRKEFKEIDKAG